MREFCHWNCFYIWQILFHFHMYVYVIYYVVFIFHKHCSIDSNNIIKNTSRINASTYFTSFSILLVCVYTLCLVCVLLIFLLNFFFRKSSGYSYMYCMCNNNNKYVNEEMVRTCFWKLQYWNFFAIAIITHTYMIRHFIRLLTPIFCIRLFFLFFFHLSRIVM